MENTSTKAVYPKGLIRYAVLSFYLAQGLCFSSWASRIPDIKDLFAVDYAFYWGLILFLIPVGKFTAIPLAGYLVTNLGSRIMVQISILGYALSLLPSDLYPMFICSASFYSVSAFAGIYAIFHLIHKVSALRNCMEEQSWPPFMEDGVLQPV